MLPKIDGISLCKKLRDRELPTSERVYYSCDRSTDIVEGLNAGTNDYLVKPFNHHYRRSGQAL